MRRIVVLASAVTLAFGLAACSKSGDSGNTSTTNVTTTTTTTNTTAPATDAMAPAANATSPMNATTPANATTEATGNAMSAAPADPAPKKSRKRGDPTRQVGGDPTKQ